MKAAVTTSMEAAASEVQSCKFKFGGCLKFRLKKKLATCVGAFHAPQEEVSDTIVGQCGKFCVVAVCSFVLLA